MRICWKQKGNDKGEALIVYLQEDSADLAVTWFHDTELRTGKGPEEGTMTVTRASFSHKQQPAEGDAAANGGKKQKGDPKKAKAQKRAEKLKKFVLHHK